MKTNKIFSKEWTFERVSRVSTKFAFAYAVLNVIWILIFGNKSELVLNIRLCKESLSEFIPRWIPLTKTIVLPWDSWFLEVILNYIGITLFGFSLFGIIKFIKVRLKNDGEGTFLVWMVVVSFLTSLFTGLLFDFILIMVAGVLFVSLEKVSLEGVPSDLPSLSLAFGAGFGLTAGFMGLSAGVGIALILVLTVTLVVAFVFYSFAKSALFLKIIFSKKFWISVGKKILFSWRWFISSILLCFAFSCSEDIYLHDGKDGKDGHSMVSKIDTVFSSDNHSVLGYTTSYYLDLDDNLIYSAGDKFDNSITILNGANGTNGTNGQNGKTPGIIFSIVDSTLSIKSTLDGLVVSSISFSLPKDGKKGADGKNGNDGYSPVMSVKEIKQGDKVIGNESSFYLDTNRDGIVSLGEPYLGGFVVFNGVDGTNGQNGQDGKTPCITFSVVDSVLTVTSTLDGTVVSTVKFNLPKDGKNGVDGINGTNGSNGLTPSLKTIPYTSPCGCGGASGIVYIWYFDINGNGIFDAGEPNAKSIICNGKDGSPSKQFIPLTLSWDFAGQSTNASYVANGWIFDGSGISDGNVYMTGAGKLTTPVFRDNVDLLSLTFLYGSATSRMIKVIAIMDDFSEEVIDEFTMDAIFKFKINDYSKYKTFQYYADLDNLQFKNVKRIRIEASTKLKCVPEDFVIRQLTVDLNDRNVQ